MRSLADRNHEHARVGIEIVQVLADPEYTALAMHMLRESLLDGGVLQRRDKNVARRFSHAKKLLQAL